MPLIGQTEPLCHRSSEENLQQTIFLCPQVVPPQQRLSSTGLYSYRRKSSERRRWKSGIGSECVMCVSIWYVNVFLVLFGALLLLHVELQELNKIVVIYTVHCCLFSVQHSSCNSVRFSFFIVTMFLSRRKTCKLSTCSVWAPVRIKPV